MSLESCGPPRCLEEPLQRGDRSERQGRHAGRQRSPRPHARLLRQGHLGGLEGLQRQGNHRRGQHRNRRVRYGLTFAFALRVRVVPRVQEISLCPWLISCFYFRLTETPQMLFNFDPLTCVTSWKEPWKDPEAINDRLGSTQTSGL